MQVSSANAAVEMDTGGVLDFDDGLGDWCQSCRRLRNELEKIKTDQTLNYTTLKEKIISTDQLIKKYNTKGHECENLIKELEEMKKLLDKSKRECETLTIQLKAAVGEVEPLKRANEKQESVREHQDQVIEELQTKVKALEITQQQTALLNSQKDSEDTSLKRKLKDLESSKKKNDSALKKVQDELQAKKNDLTEEKKKHNQLKISSRKLQTRVKKLEEIISRKGLLSSPRKKSALSNFLSPSPELSHPDSPPALKTLPAAENDAPQTPPPLKTLPLAENDVLATPPFIGSNGFEELLTKPSSCNRTYEKTLEEEIIPVLSEDLKEKINESSSYEDICVELGLNDLTFLRPLSPALSPLTVTPAPQSQDDFSDDSNLGDSSHDNSMDTFADMLESEILHESPKKTASDSTMDLQLNQNCDERDDNKISKTVIDSSHSSKGDLSTVQNSMKESEDICDNRFSNKTNPFRRSKTESRLNFSPRKRKQRVLSCPEPLQLFDAGLKPGVTAELIKPHPVLASQASTARSDHNASPCFEHDDDNSLCSHHNASPCSERHDNNSLRSDHNVSLCSARQDDDSVCSDHNVTECKENQVDSCSEQISPFYNETESEVLSDAEKENEISKSNLACDITIDSKILTSHANNNNCSVLDRVLRKGKTSSVKRPVSKAVLSSSELDIPCRVRGRELTHKPQIACDEEKSEKVKRSHTEENSLGVPEQQAADGVDVILPRRRITRTLARQATIEIADVSNLAKASDSSNGSVVSGKAVGESADVVTLSTTHTKPSIESKDILPKSAVKSKSPIMSPQRITRSMSSKSEADSSETQMSEVLQGVPSGDVLTGKSHGKTDKGNTVSSSDENRDVTNHKRAFEKRGSMGFVLTQPFDVKEKHESDVKPALVSETPGSTVAMKQGRNLLDQTSISDDISEQCKVESEDCENIPSLSDVVSKLAPTLDVSDDEEDERPVVGKANSGPGLKSPSSKGCMDFQAPPSPSYSTFSLQDILEEFDIDRALSPIPSGPTSCLSKSGNSKTKKKKKRRKGRLITESVLSNEFKTGTVSKDNSAFMPSDGENLQPAPSISANDSTTSACHVQNDGPRPDISENLQKSNLHACHNPLFDAPSDNDPGIKKDSWNQNSKNVPVQHNHIKVIQENGASKDCSPEGVSTADKNSANHVALEDSMIKQAVNLSRTSSESLQAVTTSTLNTSNVQGPVCGVTRQNMTRQAIKRPFTDSLTISSGVLPVKRSTPAPIMKEMSVTDIAALERELEFFVRFSLSDSSAIQKKIILLRPTPHVLAAKLTQLLAKCNVDMLGSAANMCRAGLKPDSAPWLTSSEMQLFELVEKLASLNGKDKLHEALYSECNRVLKSSHDSSLFGFCSVLRFMTALCRVDGDLERAAALAYSSIYCFLGSFEFLLVAIATSWPLVLQKEANAKQYLIAMLEYITFTHPSLAENNNSKVLSCLRHLCAWDSPSLSAAQLAINYVNEMNILSSCPKASDEIEEIVSSLVLLSGCQGWKWTNNTLVIDLIWPPFRQWWQGLKVKCEGQATVSESFISHLIHMLGEVGSLCPSEHKSAVAKDIMTTLITLIQPPHCHNVSELVQLSVLKTLLKLSPFQPDLVASVSVQWLETHPGSSINNVRSQLNEFAAYYHNKLLQE